MTTHRDLVRRVWGPCRGNPQAVRSAVRKLGDDACNLTDIFGERGMDYRMPKSRHA